VDIANAAHLYDFQLALNFDPAILQPSDVLEGTFLSGGTFFIPQIVPDTWVTLSLFLEAVIPWKKPPRLIRIRRKRQSAARGGARERWP